MFQARPYGPALGPPPTLAAVPPAVVPAVGPTFMTGFANVGPEPVPAGLTAPALLAAVALRRGQPQGPANDQEVEDFLYDVLELLPGASDVEVRCENGRVTITGSVQHKRVKHDVGEIAWAIPALSDVQNNVTIASRRRSRTAGREGEATQAPARKTA
jgi:hypothetical protein